MGKKIFSYLLILLLGCCLRAEAQRYIISPRNGIHAVSEDKMRASLEFLSDSSLCAGRRIGTRGSTWAKTWILSQYRRIGLLPCDSSYVRSFAVSDSLAGHNLIGMIPGRDTSATRSYIVVGAYFDGLGRLNGKIYPGADSNASGVVTLLSLAEMLHEMNEVQRYYDRGVIFVAFDGKQRNMSGSEAFWKCLEEGSLTDPVTGGAITAKQIALMVNIDQIGSTLSPLQTGDLNYLIMLSEDKSPQRELLQLCNTRYFCYLDLGFDYYGSPDFTQLFYRKIGDQKVFLDHGIKSVMFTSGITMHNNKPYDDADSLDIEVLHRRASLIFFWMVRNI